MSLHRRRLFEREEVESTPRAVAELSARALIGNYRAIHDQVPGLSMLPMIKANAYGHGAGWAAETLHGLPGLYGFGVATLEEGIELRRGLGPRARRTRIVVFSGALPWTEDKGQLCERHGLVPVIASDDDWHAFLRQGWPERISYELKFNTGMNRLGISTSLAPAIARSLRNRPSSWHPSGVLTHLAMGESPEAKLSRQQLARYEGIRGELTGALPSTHFHFANSAAIWNSKHWRVRDLSDVVRPGLSLYGVPPWPGAPVRGLAPVMTTKALVLAVHAIKPGESVGYGGLFTVPTKGPDAKPTRVAILGAGYADGVHRTLSNKGHVWLRDQLVPMLGRVSMDMSAVLAPLGARVGDQAEWLGPRLDPWKLAAEAGTNAYELLTSIAPRVQRRYV